MNNLFNNDCYRFIFENSHDAILLTSPDGTIHRANPAACKMFQRTEDEICEAGRNGLVDVNDERLALALKERAETGQARTELTLVRKDGSKFIGDCSSIIFQNTNKDNFTAMLIRDVTETKQIEEDLRLLASKDYLTDVLNRRAFIEQLQKELERAKRNKTDTSIIISDIDDFKRINDTFGHILGDETLKAFAVKLTHCIRPYDLIGRFGGDEFIVCLPNTSAEKASSIAQRLLGCVNDIIVNNSNKRLSASFGVASFPYSRADDIDALITRADNAMYKAKTQKNSIYLIE